MKRHIKILKIKEIAVILCVLQHTQVSAQQNLQWQRVTDDNGIQVYTIEQDDTDIVKAKAIIEIKSSMQNIRKELDDIASRHEWIPFLVGSSLIIKNSATHRLEYSLFSAPWPASDRDFVYSLALKAESAQQIIYTMQSVKSELMPETGDYIRGEIFESIYVITKINNERSRVELSYHADPKGWLPNWIVNIIQRVLPYKILRNLRRRLETQEPQ